MPEERDNEHRSMGTGMFVLAWLVLGGMLAFAFSDILDKQRNPNQAVETQPCSMASIGEHRAQC